MPDTKVFCLWNSPASVRTYRTGVSLHSHTNHSKESLHFIPRFASRWTLLHRALEYQCKRAHIPVDFVRAYWTPPLGARPAYKVEKQQIEDGLGLTGIVSLTDHDNMEAAVLLRVVPETREIPMALEWSVPFGRALFHLGVHNLPNGRAQEIMADLAAYTRNPSDQLLTELLDMLNRCPEVLIVFNHPVWDQYDMGHAQYLQLVDQFLHLTVGFLHAFELNATRSWKENDSVTQLANRWQRLLVSGGDRHGCQPSGAVNLTCAESFPEFVDEIRVEKRSQVLFMPRYSEPSSVRIAQELVDVIRDYPEFPAGSRRWDDRVFHPDPATNADRPLSTYWKAPPAFIEYVLSAIRALDNAALRRALMQVLRREEGLRPSPDAVDGALM